MALITPMALMILMVFVVGCTLGAPPTHDIPAPGSTPATPGSIPGTPNTSDIAAPTNASIRFILTDDQLPDSPQHTTHLTHFGHAAPGFNRFVLAGIDTAQATAPDGGGYFIGITADPPESPIGYALELLDQPLLDPPRTTSYCSGSTYTAFIEALNHYLTQPPTPDNPNTSGDASGGMSQGGASTSGGVVTSGGGGLDPVRAEAMRMQEPDGSRREDRIKFWGHWNDDGFGNHFSLVQYSKMGQVIAPQHARPGDFMNISWTNGGGHSVIFLAWHQTPDGEKRLRYWSSQASTDGMSDQSVPLSRIRAVKVVRVTDPDQLFTFDPDQQVNRKIPGDKLHW